MQRIYMDYASTTPVAPEVAEAMLPWINTYFGNPSSQYEEGRKARKTVEAARLQVAQAIGADPKEIYFTSCGSESDNWALKGVAFRNREKGNHIIVSSIEHHAVLNTCRFLEREGFEVTYLPVDAEGVVDLDALEKAIKDTTILVSIMMANNEIGTLQPMEAIADMVKPRGIILHTDAVQAFGSLPVNVKKMNVDMLSLSGHKVYGPKGIGALYLRKGVPIANLIDGGNQENKRRAGTENVANIVGLGQAAALTASQLDEDTTRLIRLRDQLIEGILSHIPQSRLTGHPSSRLPGNASFCFDFLDAQAILTNLDMDGIAASSGSACTAGAIETSHVLEAIGLPESISRGAVRFSLGRYTTEEEVVQVIEKMTSITERLRRIAGN